jgi:hypothetical protein
MDGTNLHNYHLHNQGWGLHTHIYSVRPSLDITLILKIPAGYYNTNIKFNKYRGRGLSNANHGQMVSQMEK